MSIILWLDLELRLWGFFFLVADDCRWCLLIGWWSRRLIGIGHIFLSLIASFLSLLSPSPLVELPLETFKELFGVHHDLVWCCCAMVHGSRVLVMMQCWCCVEVPDVGIVLLHDCVADSGFWTEWNSRLRVIDWPIRAIDLQTCQESANRQPM